MIPNFLYISPSVPLIIQNQFVTIQNLQRSPIPQTSNWSGTFFAVSYSKLALVVIESYSFFLILVLPFVKAVKDEGI